VVRRETGRAIAGVGAGSRTKIWPGIEIDIPTGENEKRTTAGRRLPGGEGHVRGRCERRHSVAEVLGDAAR
jgi:hypothetical protein